MSSVHRRVIRVIDERWGDETPFSPSELVRESGCSRMSVFRILRTLVALHVVMYSAKARSGRHYCVSAKWTTADDVIYSFEMERVIR